MKKKQAKKRFRPFHDLLLRYIILIVVAVPNLWLFYAVFTPLTVYPSYLLSKIFFNTVLIAKDIFIVNGLTPIELTKSCIAGAAYYLLLILNLSVPKIGLKKRLLMIGLSFLSLLLLNIIRVVALVWVYMTDFSAFDLTHKLFWYALSTVFVVAIWFAEVKIFKIKDIPVYSDIKFLFKKAIMIK